MNKEARMFFLRMNNVFANQNMNTNFENLFAKHILKTSLVI